MVTPFQTSLKAVEAKRVGLPMLLQHRWPQGAISSKPALSGSRFASIRRVKQIVAFPLAVRPVLVHRNSANTVTVAKLPQFRSGEDAWSFCWCRCWGFRAGLGKLFGKAAGFCS
jgi:hypothetical protein